MAKEHDLHGTPVSEEEAALDLGFKDVIEFRRWQTDVAHKNQELKFKLNSALREARGFQWHGERDHRILKKCDEVMKDLQDGKPPSPEHLKKLRLAIAVVMGMSVDWDGVLKDWLDDFKPI